MTSQPAPQEPKSDKNGLIETRDYWEIVMLMGKGFSPVDVKATKTPDGEGILIFWFPPEARPLFDDYCMMRPVPISDIRDIERAARAFKSFKHRLARN